MSHDVGLVAFEELEELVGQLLADAHARGLVEFLPITMVVKEYHLLWEGQE